MTIAAFLEVISGFFKFPDAVLRLVQALQKTPQEQHEALLQASEAEALNLAKTGRPTWT